MNTEKPDLASLRINRNNIEPDPSQSSGKTVKTVLWGIVLVAIVGGLLLVGWNKLTTKPIEVKTTFVALRTKNASQATLTASGYVVAQRKASVASKGTGQLVYLGVKEGDRVKKDQVIARLQDDDIRAQLAAAVASLALSEASLVEAKNNFERQKKLRENNSLSSSEFEITESNYKKVLASIDLAKAQKVSAEVALDNMIIRAPFDGTVLTKNADIGEMVAPFAAGANSRAAVVTIADMSSLQIEADVSESNIQKVKLNEPCDITLDAYPGSTYAGFVTSIVPTADRSKGTVQVKVGFHQYDERVLPEMSAKVNFLKDRDSSITSNEPAMLMIPEESIATRNNQKLVFKIVGEKAVAATIQVGQNFNGFIEVKSGLVSGDQIIQTVTDQIIDGTAVKTN